ncbi:MAG: hypothetical protein EXS51_00465 [Candidatus Taylorbacteria bacterium]|nr:hypothetical protein [Candidatus Taylorbacteria bacterium]
MDNIFLGKKLVAIHVKRFKDGTHGVTDPKQALQLLTQKRAKGHIVVPHLHLPKERVTKVLQEGLIVISGKLRIDLYDAKKQCFRSFLVKSGEAAVLLGVAHAVHFLEETLLYEFKNGPYLDDKKFL